MIFQEHAKSYRLLLLCFVMIFTFSCTQTEKYQGRYNSSQGDSRENAGITIELKENGHGLWMMAEEEVEIRWEVRNGQLLLHTKSGGVIVGEISGDMIKIQQPDARVLSLKKVR
jgi:hypothetical protein